MVKVDIQKDGFSVINIEHPSESPDNRRWRITVNGNKLIVALWNDAISNVNNVVIERDGTKPLILLE